MTYSFLPFIPWDRVSLWTWNSAGNHQGLESFRLYPLPTSTACYRCSWPCLVFYGSSRNLNSGGHVCSVSTLSCWAVFPDLIQSLKKSTPLERNCTHFQEQVCVFRPTGEFIFNLPTIMASQTYPYCLCLTPTVCWMFTSEIKNLDSHIAGSPCSCFIPTKLGPATEVGSRWGWVLDTDNEEIPHFNPEGHGTMGGGLSLREGKYILSLHLVSQGSFLFFLFSWIYCFRLYGNIGTHAQC